MSTIQSVCEPVKRAKTETSDATRKFRKWLGEREFVCESTQYAVELSLKVVSLWADAMRSIQDEISIGRLNEFQSMRETIGSSVESANLILAMTANIRKRAELDECAFAYSSNFEDAVTQMANITQFIERSLHVSIFEIADEETTLTSHGAVAFKNALESGAANSKISRRPLPMRTLAEQ